MSDLPTQGSATIRIDASAVRVFAMLTDLEVLPTFSPENQRCEFLGDSTELAVGASFRGHNRSGDYEWHADCVVTEFDPPNVFAYQVPPNFEFTTTWKYEVQPDGDGCVVTESFDAPMLARPDIYPGTIEGRCDNLQKACEVTMANLKAAAEAS